MKRRDFMLLLGGAATIGPLKARAQQQAMPVLGYFSGRSANAEQPLLAPFLRQFAEMGFVSGRNVAFDYRFAQGRDESLPQLAADLVRRHVSVLIATDRSSGVAAKAATSTIPIVFASGEDPVKLGLVASLNRPGGNATGVFVYGTELGPKRLELLRELQPRPGLIALVVNQNALQTPFQVRELQKTARAIGQPLLVLSVGTEPDVVKAFAIMAQRKVVAVLFGTSPFFQTISDKLIALAARHAIPAVYEWPEFVKAGGLMSYSAKRAEIGGQMGNYAGRILKGESPSNLPVIQTTHFELVINLKTAASLGLKLPSEFLARADEVIE